MADKIFTPSERLGEISGITSDKIRTEALAIQERRIVAIKDKSVADQIRLRKKLDDAEFESIKRKIAADKAYAAKAKETSKLLAMYSEEYREKEIESDEKLKKNKLDIAKSTADDLLTVSDTFYKIMGSKSTKWLMFNKALAITSIIVGESQSIMDAIKRGGLTGFLEAALITAKATALIAKVTSSQTPSFAYGGKIGGISSSSTSDDQVIRATSGEFIHPVDSVNYYGDTIMEGIRSRVIPREAFAGLGLPSSPGFAVGGMVGPGLNSATVNMTNITDPREIDRYLASSRGKNSVLNVISSRARTVRKVLS